MFTNPLQGVPAPQPTLIDYVTLDQLIIASVVLFGVVLLTALFLEIRVKMREYTIQKKEKADQELVEGAHRTFRMPSQGWPEPKK